MLNLHKECHTFLLTNDRGLRSYIHVFFSISFYVNGRLFWGTDRMFFVERELGVAEAAPERLATPPSSGGAAKLSFYFDYSSPWSYIGFMRLGSLLRSVAPVQVRMSCM